LSKLSKHSESFGVKVNPRPEKLVRDTFRLELAALLHLARTGKSDFASDLMAKASPEQRGWLKDEMKKLEQMLRTKVDAQDEA
jgi:hypothetical protein